jgi:hypothetical protein
MHNYNINIRLDADNLLTEKQLGKLLSGLAIYFAEQKLNEVEGFADVEVDRITQSREVA